MTLMLRLHWLERERGRGAGVGAATHLYVLMLVQTFFYSCANIFHRLHKPNESVEISTINVQDKNPKGRSGSLTLIFIFIFNIL